MRPRMYYFYIYAFRRRFYPKRLTVHSGYTFVLSVFLRRLWERKPDARVLRPKGNSPPEVERSTPHFTVSVPLRCPQETVLPTLPPRVLQGAAVSGERISHGPPGNVVALGCPPPPRRVSERSVQMLPVSSPFQDIVLTAQLHIKPETSLERLVPLVEI